MSSAASIKTWSNLVQAADEFAANVQLCDATPTHTEPTSTAQTRPSLHDALSSKQDADTTVKVHVEHLALITRAKLLSELHGSGMGDVDSRVQTGDRVREYFCARSDEEEEEEEEEVDDVGLVMCVCPYLLKAMADVLEHGLPDYSDDNLPPESDLYDLVHGVRQAAGDAAQYAVDGIGSSAKVYALAALHVKLMDGAPHLPSDLSRAQVRLVRDVVHSAYVEVDAEAEERVLSQIDPLDSVLLGGGQVGGSVIDPLTMHPTSSKFGVPVDASVMWKKIRDVIIASWDTSGPPSSGARKRLRALNEVRALVSRGSVFVRFEHLKDATSDVVSSLRADPELARKVLELMAPMVQSWGSSDDVTYVAALPRSLPQGLSILNHPTEAFSNRVFMGIYTATGVNSTHAHKWKAIARHLDHVLRATVVFDERLGLAENTVLPRCMFRYINDSSEETTNERLCITSMYACQQQERLNTPPNSDDWGNTFKELCEPKIPQLLSFATGGPGAARDTDAMMFPASGSGTAFVLLTSTRAAFDLCASQLTKILHLLHKELKLAARLRIQGLLKGKPQCYFMMDWSQ